ncbi:Importin N-terminal domain-containing protein [Plasmodiophora brassicae]
MTVASSSGPVSPALLAALQASQDPSRCADGEAALAEYAKAPGFALSLLALFCTEGFAVNDRQLAGVLLKSLAKSGWDSGEAISDAEKAQIRYALLRQVGALIETKPLLTMACALICTIAEGDLPTHQWPDLLPTLLSYINDSRLAPAAIHCVSLLVTDLPPEVLPAIAASLYPVLTAVFTNPSNDAGLRYQALVIFAGLLDGIAAVDDDVPALKSVLKEHLGQWLLSLVGLFATPPGAIHAEFRYAFHVVACDVFGDVFQHFGKLLAREATAIPAIVSAVLQYCTALSHEYQVGYINQACAEECSIDRGSLPDLLAAALDMFLIFFNHLKENLEGVVRLAEVAMQVPFGDEPQMADDDSCCDSTYTPRMAALDFLGRVRDGDAELIAREAYGCITTGATWQVREVGFAMLSVLGCAPGPLMPAVLAASEDLSNPHIQASAVSVLPSGTCALNALKSPAEAVRLAAAKVLADADAPVPPVPIDAVQVLSEGLASISEAHLPLWLRALRVAVGDGSAVPLTTVMPYLLSTWSSHSTNVTVVRHVVDVLSVFAGTSSPPLARIAHDLLTSPASSASVMEGALDLLGRLPFDDDLCQASMQTLGHVLGTAQDASIAIACANVLALMFTKVPTASAPFLSSTIAVVRDKIREYPIANLLFAIVSSFAGNFAPSDIASAIDAVAPRVRNGDSDAVLVVAKIVHTFRSQAFLDAGGSRLLEDWVARQDDVHLPCAKRLTLSALAVLVSEAARATECVAVKGYAVVDTSAPRRTRSSSRSAPAAVQYVPIPFPAKVISLLVNEWNADVDDALDSSTDNDDDDAASLVDGQAIFDQLDECDDGDGEHIASGDPAGNLDIRAFVPEFLTRFARADLALFRRYVSQLNSADRHLVDRCLA